MEKVYLYSQKNGWFEKAGFYLFDKPLFKLSYKRGLTFLNGKILKTDPLILIEKLIKKFNLYAVGYLSYDYGKEQLIGKFFPQKDDILLPDIYFLFFKSYKIIEGISGDLNSKIEDIYFNTPKEEFINKVEIAKKYIEYGDIYQVNLSHRIDLKGKFFPKYIFKNIVKIQETPYLLYLQGINFSLISSSMELFLERKGNLIKTKPIKGTRKRGKDQLEDKRLYLELKNSEKEIAENLMITDLMRNDLGRIAKRGKVKTISLFDIEKYSTLYQMVSTIQAEIPEEISFKDIIKNTFPPGSITGAPKKRAVEIIAELEDLKRTIYCGALFLIKPNMDFVSSVAIRQIIFKNGKAHIYVGGGITSGSNPLDEYEETIIKGKANLKAIDESFSI